MIIGALFAPMFAIVLTDYYIIKKGRISIESFYNKCVKFKPSAFFSFGIGSIMYFILSPISQFHIESLNYNIGSTIPSMSISIIAFFNHRTNDKKD